MSFDKTRERISTLVQAALTAEGITTPLQFPNVRFQQPEDGPWMRLNINMASTNPIAIGDASQRRRRTPAVVTIQFFEVENEGTKAAQQAADALSRQLDYANDTTVAGGERLTIYFRTIGITQVGSLNGFDQHNIQITLQIDMQAA